VLNGFTMVRKEGFRPANLLSLLAGLALIALIGLMIAALRAQSPDLTVSVAITVLLSGYISFLLVSYVLYAFLYARITGLRRADFVVVLGSGLNGDQVPPLLAGRLDRGLRAYQTLARRRQDPPVVIVSGGKGSDERISEAEAMARYLIERGLPGDHLLCADQSRTTEENLAFSQAIMARSRPGYRCIIVTSNYHVFRAAIIARRLRVNGQVTGARTAGYYWPSAMLREFAAVFRPFERDLRAGMPATLLADEHTERISTTSRDEVLAGAGKLVDLGEDGIHDGLRTLVAMAGNGGGEALSSEFIFLRIHGLENAIGAAHQNVSGGERSGAASVLGLGKETDHGAAFIE